MKENNKLIHNAIAQINLYTKKACFVHESIDISDKFCKFFKKTCMSKRRVL